ncbi:MAG: type II toxin-antitoxin system Phd/YefM family antitoxin [Thiohalobacteraceae bacterium]|nr:type II toxin-antitoxin system Phd/YefM family antitoxin [Gammaproteobacteria bacterium]
MDHQINIHEAKTQMSKLIERAQGGEEFIIAKAGKPVARIVPLAKTKRTLGILNGKIRIPEDFNAPLPEAVLADFEGRG